MTPVRVVVADDHAFFRDGLRLALASAGEIDVVGEAGDGAAALDLVADLRPDVVLMDLEMPGLSGVEATRQVVATGSRTAVVVLTMSRDYEAVAAALSAGARGYVVKGADRTTVVEAVRAAARGEAVFGADVADAVLALATRPPAAVAPPFPELSDRERDVLAGVGRGLTNSVIAGQLFLSPKTVRNMVSAILAKLGVTDRHQAGALARQAGLAGAITNDPGGRR